MAWVEPNTEVRVLRGVGLDRGYHHTVFWDNDEDQATYFKSKTAYTFNPQTYQRTNRGTIRVRETYDHLMTCNYMMFRNLSHGAKWFYAFVDNCEYVNENTTEIYYTVDPMQSWQFQYEMKPCLVEREHFETDNLGESLLDESLEIGDYVLYGQSQLTFEPEFSLQDSDCCVVLYYRGQDGKVLTYKSGSVTEYEMQAPANAEFDMYNHMPTGFNVIGFQYFNSASYASENELFMKRLWSAINTIVSDNGTILCIYVIPTDLYRYCTFQDTKYDVQPLTRSLVKPTGFKYVQNPNEEYQPKNMKLFQYPYSKLTISNNKGETKDYRWEYFNPANPMYDAELAITGTIMPNPMAVIYPMNYKGSAIYYENGILLPDYLPVTWSEDSYQRWWAENKNQWSESMVFSALNAVLTTVNVGSKAFDLTSAEGSKETAKQSGTETVREVTGMVGEFANSIHNVTSLLAERDDAKNKRDSFMGSVADYALKIQEDRLHHTVYKYVISGEMAKIIDQYFSQFGYACHQVKIPNRNVRRNWCYTKTRNCIIDGDLPMKVNEDIKDIYNKGITFWRDPDHIGDYNYYNWNNEVITP